MRADDLENCTRANHHFSVSTENLEDRRLLDAASSNVASALTFAIGLPIQSLETGAYLPLSSQLSSNMNQTTQEIVALEIDNAPDQPVPGIGLATPAQTPQGFPVGISLPVVESTYGPSLNPLSISSNSLPNGQSATGPATTLNPSSYLTETANAAASAVRQSTPGRSDRISTITQTRPIVPLRHYDPPRDRVIAEPEIQVLPKPAAPVPVAPVEAAPAQDQPVKPSEVPNGEPQTPKLEQPKPESNPTPDPLSITFGEMDTAIDQVSAELTQVRSNLLSERAQGSLMIGALLAGWSGWNARGWGQGRSRRRPLTFSNSGLEAGPGDPRTN